MLNKKIVLKLFCKLCRVKDILANKNVFIAIKIVTVILLFKKTITFCSYVYVAAQVVADLKCVFLEKK